LPKVYICSLIVTGTLNSKKMKKIFALIAIVSMFAFAACTNTPKEDPAAEAEAGQTDAENMEAEKADAEETMPTDTSAMEAPEAEAPAEHEEH